MPQLLFQVRLITSVGSALFVSIYVINFIRFVKDADQGVGFSNCAHFLCLPNLSGLRHLCSLS